MFTSTQAFRGLRFLMLLITLLSFDFLRHLSYNVRNGEVCPFPEMNEGERWQATSAFTMKIF